MKVYELLALYRKLFAAMARQGISTDDIMYLDLYKEYRNMVEENRNKADICHFLSQKYKAPVSTIKKATSRLEEEYRL